MVLKTLRNWYRDKQVALAAHKLCTFPKYVDIEFCDLSINGPGWYAWDRDYPRSGGTCRLKHSDVVLYTVKQLFFSKRPNS